MIRVVFILLYVCVVCLLPGNEMITPESPSLLAEKWRWTKLEALDDYYLYCCIENDRGELWFAGSAGLLKYDGFISEKIEFSESMTKLGVFDFIFSGETIYLASNKGVYVYSNGQWSLLIDVDYPAYPTSKRMFAKSKDGCIYVATHDGLYLLEEYKINRVSDLAQPIRQVLVDQDDILWVNLVGENKAIKIPLKKGLVSSRDNWSYHSFFDDFILQSILYYDDHSQCLWSYNGKRDVPIFRLEPDSNKFVPVKLDAITKNNNHSCFFVLTDGSPVLISKSYVLTERNGAWEFIDIDPHMFPRSGIFFCERQNGDIVLGGRGESVYNIDTSSERWESFTGLHFQCEDRKGNEWFLGVDGDVLVRNDGLFSVYDDPQIIDSPVVMFHSNNDTIWVVGSHQQMAALSYLKDGKWVMHKHPEMGSCFNYLSAFELSNGNILFGSGNEYETDVGGCVKYEFRNGFYHYQYILPPNVPRRLNGIAETDDGTLWFGGLKLARKNQNAPLSYVDEFEEMSWIDHLCSDHNGNLWVAVWQKGLLRWDGNNWTEFNAPNELIQNQTVHILSDRTRQGALWVSTQGGVSYYNGESWNPDALPKELGMTREGGFMRQSRDGSIWLNYGLREWFYRTQKNYVPSSELLRQFKTIHYKPDRVVPTVFPVSSSAKLIEPANIYLKWKGVDPWSTTPMSQLAYSWKLNNGEWSPFQKQTDLLLLSQHAGIYRFKVVVRDSDGNQSEPLDLATVTISLPIWKRSWFLVLLTVSFFSFVSLIFILVRMRIRKIVEFEEFKIQFFTNMSHELRTPLTAIIGPLQSLLNVMKDADQKKVANLAFRNAKKMELIVEQILDFRKAELGKSQIVYYNGDIVHSINESVELLKPLAEAKGISIVQTSNKEKCFVKYDDDKLHKIIDNLISNAIKYTQKGGLIHVRLAFEELNRKISRIYINVEDDGVGIPKSKLKNVFNPFYRIQSNRSDDTIGSGLGLAITQQLVIACGGLISVESPISLVKGKKRGTRFRISLPLENYETNKLTRDDAVDSDIHDSSIDQSNRPQLLIIEDDLDICEFLTSELKDYDLLVGTNGVEGVKLAEDYIPDLIISDVLMPEMTGLELCDRLKSNINTCHIPIVLLTALKGDEHEIAGLEHGADDYITKPVDSDVFKKRISALLENRRRLHKQIAGRHEQDEFDAAKLSINVKDQTLLNNAHRIITLNLENPLFDVQFLSDELKMSRMTLYRKFMALTGESPSHFIKTIRLEKAADLLLSDKFTITQVSEMVGFNTSGQFSTAFKKHYYCSPSQYKRKR